MKERVQKIVQSVDRMTLRERLFLFAAVITVMAGIWEALLAGPLAAREKLAGAQVESLRQTIDTLNQSITVTAEGMSDGMPSQLERLRVLRERLAEGEKAVKVFTSDLVDPKQMRFVLEELIEKQAGLRLVSATNLAPKPLFEDPSSPEDSDTADTAGSAERSDAPKLYQHTLVLTLEGSYLDCLAYLQAVERLPWHLYWNRLEFAAGEYPKNTITIELKTLSLDEEWIGV
jgi:MSHA biogenesis protein MshJ